MIPIVLKYLKNPTVLAILGLSIALGVQSIRAAHLKSSLLRCEKAQAEQTTEYERARASGEQAARQALETAIAERDSRIREFEERAAEAQQEALAASEKAKAEAKAWKDRYEKAKREVPECKAWSEQPISCPVG